MSKPLTLTRCFSCECARLQQARGSRPLPSVDWAAKTIIDDGSKLKRPNRTALPPFRRPGPVQSSRTEGFNRPPPNKAQKTNDFTHARLSKDGPRNRKRSDTLKPRFLADKNVTKAGDGQTSEAGPTETENAEQDADQEPLETSHGSSRSRRDSIILEREKAVLRRKKLDADSNSRNNVATPKIPLQQRKPKFVKAKPQRRLEIPSMIAVSSLAMLLKVPLKRLQRTMARIGLSDDRPVLTSDDSTLIALEFNVEPVIDDVKAFDIYPSPIPAETSQLPHRPPIVAVMGHVDHGKTTLLDSLRSSSVAAGEAGGITQHIGAFQVPVAALLRPTASSNEKVGKTKQKSRKSFEEASTTAPSATSIDRVTFLDTPGHAAFKNMRSRGRDVTDIVVLVIAADDGVKSQTQEVIDLVKDGNGGVLEDIGVVVAITKCDKPDVSPHRAKESLGSAGLIVEDLGGDVPCVEVSAVSGKGLPELIEMITTIAEVRDLRAETSGVRPEGRIIESRVERGRGIVATVLMLRGTLATGADILAGTSRCRVRQMTSSSGAQCKTAGPGEPVEIAGWKDLPQAGELVLGAESEDEARRALDTRARRAEQDSMFTDVERINEKRRVEAEQEIATRAADEAARANPNKSESTESPVATETNAIKKFSILVKADVNGSEEALCGALEGIGNNEAKVDIVYSGVGEVSESDVLRAKTAGATILAFNVPCTRAIESKASSIGVPILREAIIYRLIDQVTERVTLLLPKITNTKIIAEANVLQIFNITVKGRQTVPVAGCRIQNGTISRSSLIRVVRDSETVYTGTLETLKQGKNDIAQVTKGMECGLSFVNFDDCKPGDVVHAYEEFEVKRNL